MAEEMNLEGEVEKLLDRGPFHPFTIVLTSGDRYEVTGPRGLAFGGNVVVVVHPRTGISFFRRNQIVAVDAPEPAA